MSDQQFDMSALSPDALVQAQREYMQRVYGWMVGGLVVTAVVALFVASSMETFIGLWSNPLFSTITMLAPLGLVFFISGAIHRISAATASMLFIVYSALMGLSLSRIFIAFDPSSIASTFFISAGMFASMSAYGWLTKRDLSSMGSFLFMGLIGVVLAAVVNWFLNSSALDFAISVVGVLVFTGLTAYDTQRLKEEYVVGSEATAAGKKAAILGALSLYLDFINLFLFLLRLLGRRN